MWVLLLPTVIEPSINNVHVRIQVTNSVLALRKNSIRTSQPEDLLRFSNVYVKKRVVSDVTHDKEQEHGPSDRNLLHRLLLSLHDDMVSSMHNS